MENTKQHTCNVGFNSANMICACCPYYDKCRDAEEMQAWEAAVVEKPQREVVR